MNGLEPLVKNWTGRQKGIPKVVDENHHSKAWSICKKLSAITLLKLLISNILVNGIGFRHNYLITKILPGSLIVKLLIDNIFPHGPGSSLCFFFSLNAMFVYVPYTQLHKNIVR